MGQRVGGDCDPGDVLQQVQRLEHSLVQGFTSRQPLGQRLNLPPVLGLKIHGDLIVYHVH